MWFYVEKIPFYKHHIEQYRNLNYPFSFSSAKGVDICTLLAAYMKNSVGDLKV
jgi:hypothetical protein